MNQQEYNDAISTMADVIEDEFEEGDGLSEHVFQEADSASMVFTPRKRSKR